MVLRGQAAIEHGSTRTGRWLREHRLRFALWIAVIEGVLVLVDVIPWGVALLVAATLILFWLFVGRELASDSARQSSWIGAASQVFVALIPVFVFVLKALAVVTLAILALVALVLLFRDRR
jgi:hypothetical protein